MNTDDMKKPSLWLWMSIAILILGAMFLSPNFLLGLGIMEMSLTSNLPGVRDVALAEILFFKILLFLSAFILLVVTLFWKKIYSSSVVQGIYGVNLPKEFDKKSNSFTNKTALIGYSSILLTFLYVIFSPKLFSVETLLSINMEDGILENSTAAFFLIASLISLIILFTNKKIPLSWKIVLPVYAFGFFVLAGEEISWGQRIFGIETAEVMQEHNVQNENNLHNLLGYAADHLAILVVFMYGAAIPVIAKISPFIKKMLYKLGIPVASLGLALAFFISSCIHNWTVGRVISAPTGLRYAEMREFLTGIMFVLLMIETWIMAKVRFSNSD